MAHGRRRQKLAADQFKPRLSVFSFHQELFQYGTGSYAYGCGLKSLTVKGKEVWLELFGRCQGPAMDNPGPGKFMVKDRTRVSFIYVSKGFLEMETQIITSDVTDVRNYRPEVHINE